LALENSAPLLALENGAAGSDAAARADRAEDATETREQREDEKRNEKKNDKKAREGNERRGEKEKAKRKDKKESDKKAKKNDGKEREHAKRSAAAAEHGGAKRRRAEDPRSEEDKAIDELVARPPCRGVSRPSALSARKHFLTPEEKAWVADIHARRLEVLRANYQWPPHKVADRDWFRALSDLGKKFKRLIELSTVEAIRSQEVKKMTAATAAENVAAAQEEVAAAPKDAEEPEVLDSSSEARAGNEDNAD
jgi:hypothetical protein